MAGEKGNRDVDRQVPEYTFKAATLNQFFTTPVWHTIEELLDAQEDVVLAHLTDPYSDRDDDMFFKGMLNQIKYMKNIKLILLEEA